MKTLFITDSPTVSGAEHVMLGYIDEPGRAWQPHVFLDARNRRLIQALNRRGCPYTTSDAFSRIMVETTGNPRSLVHFARSFYRVARALHRETRSRGIEIMHAVSYPASLYAALSAYWSGVPIIWHEHNIKRVHPVNRRLYQFVASTSAWMIGPSRAVTNTFELAGLDAAKIRTVYNGVDAGRFAVRDDRIAPVRAGLGLVPGDRAVALPGQMLPYKGHEVLIKIAPAILSRIPTAHFFFVGALENPPYEARLQSVIRELGVEGRFHFTGWRGDMPDLLRAMDVIVVPTTTPEPAALTLMEAMAVGRPVIAAKVGGTPEIVVDAVTGLLYEAGDLTGAMSAILRCLEDEHLSARLGRAGRERVEERFTLERHLDEMEELYRSAAR